MPAQEPQSIVKLPQISIPKFTGERKQWRSFKDLFECTIHSRTDLRDSVKMQYLVSYLEGEAKRKVDSYQINDANYREAWDALVTYYDKKKYTVFALVREFVDQQQVHNASGLKKLVATSDDVIRQLKALGNEYESRDPWLIQREGGSRYALPVGADDHRRREPDVCELLGVPAAAL